MNTLLHLNEDYAVVDVDGYLFYVTPEDVGLKLFNPYHDSQGRFTSGPTSNSFPLVSEIGQSYIAMSKAKKSFSVNAAEYLTRKEGLGPKLARTGIDLGSEVAFSWTIASAAFMNGSLLGGSATALVLASLFGASPTAAVVIGGLLVGASASAVVTQIFRGQKEKALHSFLARNAPKDNKHISFTMDQRKNKGWKSNITQMTKTGAGEIAFDVAMAAFGPYSPFPTAIGGLRALEELQEVEEADNSSDSVEFTAALLPYISAMAFDYVNSIRVPAIEPLLNFPGFRINGDNLIMTPDTLEEFALAYTNDEFPNIQIEFGNFSVSGLEEEVKLFNPYHDELGRFTSVPKNAALFGNRSRFSRDARIASQGSQVLDRTAKTLARGTTKPKIETVNSWNEFKNRTDFNSRNVLGAYTSGSNTISISPLGLEWARKDPRYIDRLITHETVHSRQRSTGNPIQFVNSKHALFEEGLTDLIALSPKNNKVNMNWATSPYLKQMQAVAHEARIRGANNQKHAWEWVTDSHFRNDDLRMVGDRINNLGGNIFRGTGSNADIDWLFSNTPRTLEELDDQFTKVFERSERDKWKEMGILI